jgi:hypothetical protein
MTNHVLDLRTAEQFVLFSMRLWWNAEESPACQRALIRNGFTAADLPERAYQQFAEFMSVMTYGNHSCPSISSLHHPHVTPDEVKLLTVVALCQQRYNGNASLLLRQWLPPASCRVFLDAAMAFAAMAAAGGLLLPVRQELHLTVSPPVAAQATYSRVLH